MYIYRIKLSDKEYYELARMECIKLSCQKTIRDLMIKGMDNCIEFYKNSANNYQTLFRTTCRDEIANTHNDKCVYSLSHADRTLLVHCTEELSIQYDSMEVI